MVERVLTRRRWEWLGARLGVRLKQCRVGVISFGVANIVFIWKMRRQRRKEKEISLAQRFAQVFAAIYLLVGILGFIPVAPFLAGTLPNVIGLFSGAEFGLFPVNWLHKIAHIAIRAAGLATFRNPLGARSYALAIGVLYLVLFLLGLILSNFFRLLPLGGADIILHLVTALIALGAYYASREAPSAA